MVLDAGSADAASVVGMALAGAAGGQASPRGSRTQWSSPRRGGAAPLAGGRPPAPWCPRPGLWTGCSGLRWTRRTVVAGGSWRPVACLAVVLVLLLRALSSCLPLLFKEKNGQCFTTGLMFSSSNSTQSKASFATTARIPPDQLLLDRSLNIGPLISRWELDKFKNCWNKSFRTSKILTLISNFRTC